MGQPAGLASDYRHSAKEAVFRGLETSAGVRLKWYDLALHGQAVSDEIHGSARAYLRERLAGGGLGQAGDCGFVILHRCGAAFYFLLVTVWRINNEAWEAVFYRDEGMTEFAPFHPAYTSPGTPRPTFCIWELGIVAFEAECWAALGRSERTTASLRAWDQRICTAVV
ncbi:MAG: hypothetical protein HC855_07200 [Rhizobiales bacterium]|nr:hypothetical protein [Hyphomicrobiales bacterium]